MIVAELRERSVAPRPRCLDIKADDIPRILPSNLVPSAQPPPTYPSHFRYPFISHLRKPPGLSCHPHSDSSSHVYFAYSPSWYFLTLLSSPQLSFRGPTDLRLLVVHLAPGKAKLHFHAGLVYPGPHASAASASCPYKSGTRLRLRAPEHYRLRVLLSFRQHSIDTSHIVLLRSYLLLLVLPESTRSVRLLPGSTRLGVLDIHSIPHSAKMLLRRVAILAALAFASAAPAKRDSCAASRPAPRLPVNGGGKSP